MTRPPRPGALLSLPLLVLAACSAGGSGASPAADAAVLPDLTDPVDLLPPPDLTPRTPEPAPLHSGPVLSSVQLVTVTYKDYVYQPDVESFGDWLVTSDYYKQVGADYGVHAGKHLAKVNLPDAWDPKVGVHDGDVRAAITRYVNAKVLPAPPPGNMSQVLYMLYYPQGTAISYGLSVLCTQFGGYHGAFKLNGTWVTYAVIGDCGGGIDELTTTVSHELIEAATDPWVNTSLPYSYVVDAQPPDHWAAEAGQEMGDLCEYLPGVSIEGHQLTRVWSPSAAMALHEPCIPWPTSDFETVVVTPSETPDVAAGDRFTFTLTGWSSNPKMKPWTISLVNADRTQFSTRAVDAKLSSTGVSHGFSVRLTVTVPAEAISGQFGAFQVLSGPNRHVAPVSFNVQ